MQLNVETMFSLDKTLDCCTVYKPYHEAGYCSRDERWCGPPVCSQVEYQKSCCLEARVREVTCEGPR